MTIALRSPTGQALARAGGRIESGSLCSPGQHRIEPIHLRIIGRSTTLCGQSVRGPRDEYRWQWYSQGRYNEKLPSYTDGSDHHRVCKSCARSPVYQITLAVMETKRAGRLT